MSQPILTKVRNIYEQQAYNRRMTWLLIVVFVLLITFIGVGFDVFSNANLFTRLIMLPFIILMAASGIWNFRQRAAAGLWKKPQAFADESEEAYDRWIFRSIILIVSPFIIIIAATLIYLHPFSLRTFFSQHIDLPMLRYLPIGTALAVILGISCVLTSIRWGKNSVLWSIRAKNFVESENFSPELLNIIKEISLAAGIPAPSLYIVNDSDPNAFTIGTDSHQSSIVLTTGLLAMLDREELQGVIAHEMSHIRNADTRLMTVITVLFGAVLLLSEWMKKSALMGGFTGSKLPGAGWILRGVLFFGWLLTLLLSPLIARIVAMAVSRQREYLADAGGAELTRNPKALARALIKIENAGEPTPSFQNSIAHLCVVDPLGRKVNSKEGWWANLFATHPPMKKRIILLNAMAYERTK